jgi:hypothetical protein
MIDRDTLQHIVLAIVLGLLYLACLRVFYMGFRVAQMQEGHDERE